MNDPEVSNSPCENVIVMWKKTWTSSLFSLRVNSSLGAGLCVGGAAHVGFQELRLDMWEPLF